MIRPLVISFTCCLWLGVVGAHGKIVFQSGRDGNGNLEIYVMKSDGTDQTRLTHHEAGDDFVAAWSPNGRQIAFIRDLDERPDIDHLDIFVMNADGSNQRNLTQHPEMDTSPDWSPDGSQIAFTSGRGKGLSIFVMDADGTNIRQLTEGPFEVTPKWSPDGKRIVYAGMVVPGAGRQIYMMNADGTNHWQVSEPIPQAGMFIDGWSPDGKKILYMAAIDYLVSKAFLVIATLHPRRHEAVKHEWVPLPKNMHIDTAAWGADGKSVLFSGRRKEGEKWNIYRFHLPDGPLINLTNNRGGISPHEWNPRLSVSPQRLVPKRWGEIKSHSHRHRGSGDILPPPIP